MSQATEEILEEQFEGAATGIEIERAPDEADEPVRPYDPDKIRVSTKNFSLRNIIDMIDNDDLELAPDFQRNQVWKPRQKARLIESLLLQIPLPAFYFAEDSDGLLRVVDGLQRLSTIHAFVRNGGFPLRDLEYLESVEGLKFADLSSPLKRRLQNAQIVVHVIDPSTPNEVKYDIFKRINTGGEPLNAMEVRHCMTNTRSRDFLARCTASEAFREATNGRLTAHIRMHDREAVLRFVAFTLLGDIADYDKYGSLERLLDWAAGQLDDEQAVPEVKLDEIFRDFDRAMTNASLLFGQHAFRKWPLGSDRLSPINRALFETWSVTLARQERAELEPHAAAIVSKAREAMTNDAKYVSAISTATSQLANVRIRFAVPENILTQVGL